MKSPRWITQACAAQSHPARGAWIEIFEWEGLPDGLESHPARGAWIEIAHILTHRQYLCVAPREGCVD